MACWPDDRVRRCRHNFARISLSEQGRELASLRVLGFTRGEVSRLLLAELAIG